MTVKANESKFFLYILEDTSRPRTATLSSKTYVDAVHSTVCKHGVVKLGLGVCYQAMANTGCELMGDLRELSPLQNFQPQSLHIFRLFLQ